jgi:hypothetical protein
LSHSYRIEKDLQYHHHKEESSSPKHSVNYNISNAMAFKHAWDMYNLKFHIGNSFLQFSGKVTPTDFNKDGKVLELQHESKYKPEKGVYSTRNSAKFNTPKVGPL